MSTMLERLPAVRRIETDRENVFAFELAGYLSAADIENLYGLLEGAYAVYDRIDLLLKFVDHEGIDRDAIMSDTAAGLSDHAGKHVNRAAMVGAPEWVSAASTLVSAFSSVKLKRFEPDEEQAAWAYIEANPT
ncbi:MAG: STAS/SEC14 domain-containing protein [Rhizobiaceae bacterium]|nr:STAS/SEC14 domain-containing protein [Rhizobiaceae bacterium]MCV0408875.1 STAS/SEC14 domain-containing protein [Rhizobiaceae bacterium]